ncbi:MAG: rod shape-determining protein RodA [Candidatus Cloacimonadota bacterium]|nr:MAG: rod shape-determining protein RodA [Candidatus Cloacimonadota bacterium]
MIDKEKFRFIDKQLIIYALLLSAIGLVVIYSATRTISHILFYKQTLWVIIGMVLMIVIIFIPRKFLYNFSYWFFAISIILIILPFILDHSSLAKRWINFYFFKFQPSEFAKLGLIMALAVLLSIKKEIISHPKELVIPFIVTCIPFFLIVIEPDLATAMVLPAILIFIVFVKGIRLKLLLFILTPLLSLLTAFHWISWISFIVLLLVFLSLYKQGFAYSFGLFAANSFIGTVTPILWKQLKPYQQQRILAFINPGADPRGAGWHILQSKIAIGSGGFWGKGFLHGTQTKLFFLPEQHTDFVFSVLGEEWGFIGIMIFLTLFLLLIIRITIIMRSTRSEWGIFILSGIAAYFLFQTFLNIGMCISILPVAGIPLPLMSYGGSQTILSFVLIGIALNIGFNRYEY